MLPFLLANSMGEILQIILRRNIHLGKITLSFMIERVKISTTILESIGNTTFVSRDWLCQVVVGEGG